MKPIEHFHVRNTASRGCSVENGKEIQREMFRRKKAFPRWNTLCIARGNNAFPAEEIR